MYSRMAPPLMDDTPARGESRSAAIFWGAAERLDSELGPTQWRTEKSKEKYWPAPAVLADEEGLAAGRALATAEAVELALGVARARHNQPDEPAVSKPS